MSRFNALYTLLAIQLKKLKMEINKKNNYENTEIQITIH